MALSTFLAPQFLINNISTIALVLAAALLVIFSDLVTKRIMLNFSDGIKSRTHEKIKAFGKQRNSKKIEKYVSKYISEILATSIFLLYCFFGAIILAEFVFTPIMLRLQNVITLQVIFLFFLISWTINTRRVRRKLMKF